MEKWNGVYYYFYCLASAVGIFLAIAAIHWRLNNNQYVREYRDFIRRQRDREKEMDVEGQQVAKLTRCKVVRFGKTVIIRADLDVDLDLSLGN